jgi:hypothetical protein
MFLNKYIWCDGVTKTKNIGIYQPILVSMKQKASMKLYRAKVV